MPAPSNRPFFANFLAAFRAHSALAKTTTSPPSVTTAASSPSQFTYPPASAAARTITTSTQAPQNQISNSTPPQTNPSTLSHIKSPASPPPSAPINTTTTSALSAATLPAAHRARHPSASPPPRSPPPNSPFNRTSPANRRGSDSSSEGGFREVLGGEKWYIGGRTATGEERFYRLGMVRKERSWEGRSFDRLSL